MNSFQNVGVSFYEHLYSLIVWAIFHLHLGEIKGHIVILKVHVRLFIWLD